MSQITLRNLPENLDREIRNCAKSDGFSLNRTIIRLLKKATGMEGTGARKRDLAGLAGRWNTAEADDFDARVKIFEEIDEDIWR